MIRAQSRRLIQAAVIGLLAAWTGGAPREVYGSLQQDGQLWALLIAQRDLPGSLRGYFEIQPRTANGLSSLGTLLIRPALGYRLSPGFSLWLGYAWAGSFTAGRPDEHRVWQQSLLESLLGDFRLVNRTRLEERFPGNGVDMSWRFRHMLRASYSFSESWSAVLFDELFFNLNSPEGGPSGGLDQNRLFAGANRKLGEHLILEGGYLAQYIRRKPADGDRLYHALILMLLINLG